jgi:hypothetical protein
MLFAKFSPTVVKGRLKASVITLLLSKLIAQSVLLMRGQFIDKLPSFLRVVTGSFNIRCKMVML